MLRVGYSRRFKECFLRAKEQMIHGRLGKVNGGLARVYNSRAQAFAILKRDPHATPVLDVLTYYVDLVCWFLEGNRPVEVVARGQSGIFRDAGYSAHDVTWALVTFADGAVVNFGVSYALPARYPTQGQSDRVELLGTDGTMIIDDDHMEHLIYTDKGIPHPYVPDHLSTWPSSAAIPRATGRSAISGDRSATRRAPGSISSSTGRPSVHATPAQALVNLKTTLAIERAVATGQPVRLDEPPACGRSASRRSPGGGQRDPRSEPISPSLPSPASGEGLEGECGSSACPHPVTDLERGPMDDKTRPDETGYRFIGKPMPRKEDERLVTGKGRFSDDFNLDGQAYAAMVRSPYPHARIVAIDTARASRCRACSASSPAPTAPPTSSARSRTIRCRRPSTT